MKSRYSIAAVLLALSLVSVWYFTAHDRSPLSEHAELGLVFPELIDELNESSEIRIRQKASEYSLVLNDGIWQVSQFDNYPARTQLVQNFLVGIAQLRKLEQKTNDPNKFAALDLAGPGVAESATIRIDVLTAAGRKSASLLIGRSQTSKRNPLFSEFYVRHPDDSQTWLTESSLAIPTTAMEWLNREVVDLDGRVQQVALLPTSGDSVLVLRASAENDDFVLADIPEQHKIRYQYRINNIGRLFRRLHFEDVRRLNEWASGVKATVRTFDGLELTTAVGRGQMRNFVRLSARPLQNASQQVIDEADRLNRRWSNWAYRLSEVRTDTFHLTNDDLLERANDS